MLIFRKILRTFEKAYLSKILTLLVYILSRSTILDTMNSSKYKRHMLIRKLNRKFCNTVASSYDDLHKNWTKYIRQLNVKQTSKLIFISVPSFTIFHCTLISSIQITCTRGLLNEAKIQKNNDLIFVFQPICSQNLRLNTQIGQNT